MADELLYMLWYHKSLGKTLKGKKALSFYGSYEKLYNAVADGTEKTGLLKSAPREKYTAFSLVDAENILWKCEDAGWHIIPCDSSFYPRLLLETYDYPHILFADGKKELLCANVKFAVVGSREASDTAMEIAANSAYNLAKTGAVIVSGAALGIDSAAHFGALKSGGGTIGVLGCGLGNSYMERIGSFYEEMKQSGVYVTELFPYENVTKGSFPDRNRIISGMCQAVLVACAAEKSGTLNTAAHAKKQKRRIYVPVPEICYSAGCDQLLRDGAYTFYNAGDIAYPFRELYDEGAFNENYCNKALSIKNRVVSEDMAFPKTPERKGTAGKKEKNSPEHSNTNEKEVFAAQKVQLDKNSSPPVKGEKNSSDEVLVKRSLPDGISETARAVYEALDGCSLNAGELCGRLGLPVQKIFIAQAELELAKVIVIKAGGRLERI